MDKAYLFPPRETVVPPVPQPFTSLPIPNWGVTCPRCTSCMVKEINLEIVLSVQSTIKSVKPGGEDG